MNGPQMNVRLVADPAALAELCAQIAAADRVALDTEFHTEKHFTPRLMVVQIAFEGEVAIVDPLALTDLQPLAAALSGVTIIGHALSSDLRILYDVFGTLPPNVYDTQVAAAFCGYGLSISLLDLVRDVARVTLRKSQTVSDWSTRPLSPAQIEYLKLDERDRRSWALDEMRSLVDPRSYRSDRRRLYQRVAGNARLNRRELGILNELATLRERVARERNIPLKYVLADDVLLGLVALRPKSVDELAQLRRLDAGVRRNLGSAIVDAIAAGEALAEDDLPPRAPRPLGAQRDAVVAALALLVNALAAANGLPSTLLVARAGIERVARDLPGSPDAIAELLDLTPWRRALVAEPIFRLLRGEIAIRVAGYDEAAPRMVIDVAQSAEVETR
jgi:ribonuclease D